MILHFRWMVSIPPKTEGIANTVHIMNTLVVIDRYFRIVLGN